MTLATMRLWCDAVNLHHIAKALSGIKIKRDTHSSAVRAALIFFVDCWREWQSNWVAYFGQSYATTRDPSRTFEVQQLRVCEWSLLTPISTESLARVGTKLACSAENPSRNRSKRTTI